MKRSLRFRRPLVIGLTKQGPSCRTVLVVHTCFSDCRPWDPRSEYRKGDA